jgi:ABC-type multidrug transport system ATPase subunit
MHRSRASGKLRPENRNREPLLTFSLPLPETNTAAVASSIVSLTNLVKQFGRFAALRGVTAEFAAHKLYAIVGDNGAGKTTLLRALAGLTQPTVGKLSILGSPDIRSVCRHIGYMAHPSLLYDEMSGMENLRYFARLYEIDDDRCASAIAAVKLDPALERPVGQYSQGMRQRMSLARALLNDPKILLLDEPFSNVDVPSAREMVSLLTAMRDAGKTIFVVTHQADLLLGSADEIVKMEAGKIVSRASGAPLAEPQ